MKRLKHIDEYIKYLKVDEMSLLKTQIDEIEKLKEISDTQEFIKKIILEFNSIQSDLKNTAIRLKKSKFDNIYNTEYSANINQRILAICDTINNKELSDDLKQDLLHTLCQEEVDIDYFSAHIFFPEISIENHRIHIVKDLIRSFRNLNLMTKIYLKALEKNQYLISNRINRSEEAQLFWSKLIQHPNVYSCVKNGNIFLIIQKDLHITEYEEILTKFFDANDSQLAIDPYFKHIFVDHYFLGKIIKLSK